MLFGDGDNLTGTLVGCLEEMVEFTWQQVIGHKKRAG